MMDFSRVRELPKDVGCDVARLASSLSCELVQHQPLSQEKLQAQGAYLKQQYGEDVGAKAFEVFLDLIVQFLGGKR